MSIIYNVVKKFHDEHCRDKEVLVTIRKAIDASLELRSKKQLIEAIIDKLKAFFDRYFEIGDSRYAAEPGDGYRYDLSPRPADRAAESKSEYGGRKEDR